MSRRFAALLLGAALGVLLVGGVYLLWTRGRTATRPAGAPEAAAPPPTTPGPAAAAATRWEARLYFPSSDGVLAPETRELEPATSPSDAVGGVVRALLAGPSAANLVAVFPPEVTLSRALVMPDGTTYVDLRGAEGGEPPSAGSEMEMLRVYALVDSVLWNVPETSSVVLLWNGEQRPSLSGHVNTGSPLLANRQLLTSPP